MRAFACKQPSEVWHALLNDIGRHMERYQKLADYTPTHSIPPPPRPAFCTGPWSIPRQPLLHYAVPGEEQVVSSSVPV